MVGYRGNRTLYSLQGILVSSFRVVPRTVTSGEFPAPHPQGTGRQAGR